MSHRVAPLPLVALALLAGVAACPAPGGGDGVPDAGEPDAGVVEAPAAVRVLLDREPVQLVRGESDELSFEVPEGVYSLAVTIEGEATETYMVGAWRDIGGTDLVYDGWWETAGTGGLCLDCAARVTAMEGVGTALAPNGPEARVYAGRNLLRVAGFRPSGFRTVPSEAIVRVTIHGKFLPEEPVAGVLDLNLHFTGARWSADTAPGSAQLQAILDGVDAIYRQIGLKLGTIRYFDVPAEYQVVGSVSGPDSELMALFAESGAHPDDNAVNLFFVDELTSEQGGVILGISGGIPGPTLRQGTSRSGVAVLAYRIRGTGSGVHEVIAHEVGHFLGLFHTSEYDFWPGQVPQVHDPLPDTPENDEAWLMHASGGGELLSDWQGRVMRANPWIRHEGVR